MRNGRTIGLFLVGLLIAATGGFLWLVEADELSIDLAKAETPYGVQVWENESASFPADEVFTPEELEAAGGELVFTGSLAEANAFIEETYDASNDYWLEGIVIGVGVLLMIAAFIPGSRSSEEPKEEATDRQLAAV